MSLPLYISPPLHPSIHPFLSVWVHNNGLKHLRLPGNYGRAKTASSAAPMSSGTPQLALHLHLPSLCCSPDDQRRIISLKRQRRVERENRQMSDLRGTRVVADEDSETEVHQNCPSKQDMMTFFQSPYFITVFSCNFMQIDLYSTTPQPVLGSQVCEHLKILRCTGIDALGL